VDKHTLKGRAHGKTCLDFAREGSLVYNEDKNFYFSRLRQVYLEKKVVDTDPSKAVGHVTPLDINEITDPWDPACMGTHNKITAELV
jgi:hypothetical protein